MGLQRPPGRCRPFEDLLLWSVRAMIHSAHSLQLVELA